MNDYIRELPTEQLETWLRGISIGPLQDKIWKELERRWKNSKILAGLRIA